MSFDYRKMSTTAKRLLTRFGQAVTVQRTTTGGYDPLTGTVTGGASGYTCHGAVMNYRNQDIDGTLIMRGDVRVLLAPDAGFAPNPGDKVTLAAGGEMTVISAKQTHPSGFPVLYEVQCRG